MKNLFCLLAFAVTLLASTKVSAYDDVRTLAIGNTSNPIKLSEGDVQYFEAAVSQGANATTLCRVLERREWKRILDELKIQQAEEFLDGKIVPQSQSLGAEYLILLSLLRMDAVETKGESKDGKIAISTTSTFSVGLKIVSVRTGEIFSEETINISDKTGSISGTISKSDAMTSLKSKFADQLKIEVAKVIYTIFPPEIEIVMLEKEKKGKAKAVLVQSSHTLPKNGRLIVYEEEEKSLNNGSTIKQEVEKGQLMIESLSVKEEGIYYFECDVKKGGEDILTKLNNKEVLQCKITFEVTGLNKYNPFAKKIDFF